MERRRRSGQPGDRATALSAGFPVQGSQVPPSQRQRPDHQPLGGPFPTGPRVSRERGAHPDPSGAKGVSFAWEFHVAESPELALQRRDEHRRRQPSPGTSSRTSSYADTSATPQTAGSLTLCTGIATTPIEGSGPAERRRCSALRCRRSRTEHRAAGTGPMTPTRAPPTWTRSTSRGLRQLQAHHHEPVRAGIDPPPEHRTEPPATSTGLR